MHRSILLSLAGLAMLGGWAGAQAPKQPKVQPGPMEPDWEVVLRSMYGLSIFGDLLNPVDTRPEATPGLFRKAGPGPVTFTPAIALGLETTTRGGWYVPGPDLKMARKTELWSYRFKNTSEDIATGAHLPPVLLPGSTISFDPGDEPFGVWVANDNFQDGGVFSEPGRVKAVNERLAGQPYKAMIYPVKDKMTGKVIPHGYLIGFEYSTNDDFQDVVCRIENVQLLTPDRAPAGEK